VELRDQRLSNRETIDLVELAESMWEQKWRIIAPGMIAGLLGVAYALLATPIYRVQAVLAPVEPQNSPALQGGLGGLASLAGINLSSGGNDRDALAILRSRAFIESFIERNDLLPVLFAEEWDSENGRWKDPDPEDWKDLRDGVDYFVKRIRSVDSDPVTRLVTLRVDWNDAAMAVGWVEDLVHDVNQKLRERDLERSRARLEYLNERLESASLVELRQAISRLIENEVQVMMVAEGETEYAFTVIDPPRVPLERIRPQRKLIVFLSGTLGGMIGIVWVLMRLALARRRAEKIAA